MSMKIEFKTEGGVAHFPGLSQPTTIDSDQMSDSEALQLSRLVEAANFFALTGDEGAVPKGAADYRVYTITVDQEGRRHTIRVTDLAKNSNLKALVDFLRKKDKELRAKKRGR